jgi:hypothetical protein
LKEIRDYLYKNRVYIWKEARKLVADSLLEVIHEPTPLKWPTDDPTDDSTDDSADDSANDPVDDPADDPTDDPTLALLLLSTAPI